MTWYAIYVTSSGALVSTGTSAATPDVLTAQGYTALTLTTDPTGQIWDPVAKTFSAAPPRPTILSVWEFVQRFTPQEFAAIEASTDPTVRQFLLMLQVAQVIKPADTVVQQGLSYLASLNLLTSARATAIGAQ